MIYTDLVAEVTSLGYNSADNNLLLVSANRALRELYNSRRIVKSVSLATRGFTPALYYKQINCKSGSRHVLPLKGAAYSMRIHGKGQYMICDGDKYEVIHVDSPDEAKLIKGFLTYGGDITFWSSYSFTVYDFSVYDFIYSDDESDIPDGSSTTVIDLRKKYGDFMSFYSPARDGNGKRLENCKLYDGKVEIDSDYTGEIILTYRRLPEMIAGLDEEVVDVPDEYIHLFPLLVASYAMLKTSEATAKYYKSLYDECIARIDKNCYADLDFGYVDTNGWA